MIAGGRRLVVGADDFGASSAVNHAVIRAFCEGVLTSTSLMVGAPAAEEAVALAREHPGLGVGLHLVLAQGRPLLERSVIPALLTRRGTFRDAAVPVGFRYYFHPGIRAQLRSEIAAQLDRFHSTGLPLSHVDGHLNLHLHPAVLPILCDLAHSARIRAMRLTRERLGLALRLDAHAAARKVAESIIFRALCCHAAPKLRRAGIAYPAEVFGLHQSGAVTEEYMLGVIAALGPGVSEFYCHPALDGAQGERELSALTSPRVREALAHAGVELVTYWQL